jgi:ribose transport system substrate-binding protein
VRSSGKSGRIRVIGCDQTLDLLFLLRQGLIDSLVVQDTRTMGYLAIGQIAAQQHGDSVPLKTLVQPSLVTRENVDDDGIQRILDSRWRLHS